MMSITCSDQYNIYCDLRVGVAGGGGLSLEGLGGGCFLFQTCGGLTFPVVLYHSTVNICPWNTGAHRHMNDDNFRS